jgi:hypothetical protein
MSVLPAITALRAAGEKGDADAVAGLLAPGVVFHSPLTARIRFEGREAVAALHRDIFAVLENLETAEPLADGDTGSFTFRARVRGTEIEALNVVRVDDQGRIAECKVFARPLPGVATLFSALPPRVAARRHGPVVGVLVALLARPLAFVLRTADRLVPKLV